MRLLILIASVVISLTARAQVGLPTGTFTLGELVSVIGMEEWKVTAFKVTQCAGMYDANGLGNGQYAIRYPIGLPVALDIFIGGHGGQAFWTEQALKMTGISVENTRTLFNDLLASNHVVVQLKFTDSGWFGAPEGQRWGFKLQANRVATFLKAMHDNIAMPLRLPMQLAGGSGGSAAIAYSISFYDSDQYLARAVLISGPPFAAIDEGCKQVAGLEYGQDAATLIDAANGERDQKTRPCTNHITGSGWVKWWNLDSVENGGRYFYPATDINFIEGAQDNQAEIKSRENLFFNLILASGQKSLSFQLFPNMRHNIQSSDVAMQYLSELLQQ